MICSQCQCPVSIRMQYTWRRGLIICRTCWEIESHDLFVQEESE